jgi:Transposase DDE domain group 1
VYHFESRCLSLSQTPAFRRSRLHILAQSGFFNHDLVEWLEARRARFVIVARLTPPIKRKLSHLRYVTPSRGVEVAEFRYQPTRWPRSYRFVVIRRRQPEEPTSQLTLFKLGRYHCQVLVTNLPLRPLNLWRFYNDRAGVELLIKQLKGDYALGSIPTRCTFTCSCSRTTWSTGSSGSACLQSSRTRPCRPCGSGSC